jgi:hypothetical protein
MGDRYILNGLKCQQCGHIAIDVYYAPSCGFTDFQCVKCGAVNIIQPEFTCVLEEKPEKSN